MQMNVKVEAAVEYRCCYEVNRRGRVVGSFKAQLINRRASTSRSLALARSIARHEALRHGFCLCRRQLYGKTLATVALASALHALPVGFKHARLLSHREPIFASCHGALES